MLRITIEPGETIRLRECQQEKIAVIVTDDPEVANTRLACTKCICNRKSYMEHICQAFNCGYKGGVHLEWKEDN